MMDYYKAVVKLPRKSSKWTETIPREYYNSIVGDKLYIEGTSSTITESEVMQLVYDFEPEHIYLNRYGRGLSGYIKFSSKFMADRAFTSLSGGIHIRTNILLQFKINSPTGGYPEPEPMSGILYVKNLPSDTNNHNLYDLFRPFGPMYLCKILIPFKGAALVQYFHSESAQNLEHVMNNKVVQGNIINITPYISAKQNGEVLLTSAKKNDRIDYTNLYVKNLHFNIKSSDLFNHFRRFGKIISARVMKNPQTDQSKGFGFVSFNKAEEAIKAQAEMNGYLILSKPIIVAFHEPNKKTLHMKSYQPNLVRSPTPPLESCSCCPTPTTLYPQQKQNVDYTKQHIASSNTKESAYFYVDTNSTQDKNVTKKYTMKRELSHPGYPPLSTGCYKLPSPLKEFVRRRSLETSNSNNSNGEITYIRRDRVAKAVFALNKDEKNLNEIVDMLLTLHKRDLATCLFNESFLIAKIQQAKEALDVFREENLNDVLFPPKESRAIAIISPVTKTAIQIDKVFDLKALKQLSVYEQKKTLGDHLFPLVKLAGIKHAPKVTISLLDTYTIDELAQIMHDQNKLNKKIAQLPITTTNP